MRRFVIWQIGKSISEEHAASICSVDVWHSTRS